MHSVPSQSYMSDSSRGAMADTDRTQHCSHFDGVCRRSAISKRVAFVTKVEPTCMMNMNSRSRRPLLVALRLNSRGVGPGISPGPQPRTGRATFTASGSPDCLDYYGRFSSCGTPGIGSGDSPRWLPARSWRSCLRVGYGRLVRSRA